MFISMFIGQLYAAFISSDLRLFITKMLPIA